MWKPEVPQFPIIFAAWIALDKALTNRKNQQKYTSVGKGKAFLQTQEGFWSTCCIVGMKSQSETQEKQFLG